MKIAITQRQTTINGITYDCLEQGWYRLFKDHEIIAIPNLVYVDLDVDLLVLSGGNHTDARYKTELYCCTWAEKNKVPILGICHGAFFINYAFKGINAEVENHRGVEHTIAMEGQTHIVNSYHDMCIYELSEEFDAIAQCNEQVEAFKHKSKDIWGIVWHPERMENPVLPTEIRKLIYG